jgi:hypothetical protein
MNDDHIKKVFKRFKNWIDFLQMTLKISSIKIKKPYHLFLQDILQKNKPNL